LGERKQPGVLNIVLIIPLTFIPMMKYVLFLSPCSFRRLSLFHSLSFSLPLIIVNLLLLLLTSIIKIHMLSIDLSYFLYHIFHVHVYKYFQIMLLFIFISLVVSTAHSFETTICDCSKPTGIGLLTFNRKGAVVSYPPILRVI
jgi:hypothetical protein